MKLDYEQIPKKFVNFTRKKLLCKHANFIFKNPSICVWIKQTVNGMKEIAV